MGDALPHVAAWAQPGATWAPSVLQRGSNYVLYYSALDGTTGEQCISEAVAGQPQGPYVDSSTHSAGLPADLGGSMDPSPFVGTNGTPYLTWKSQGADGQPPTLWSQQLTPNGTALVARATHRAAHPQPGLAGRGGRRAGHGGVRRPVPALLLGQQLADRQLRHRRGRLQWAARARARSRFQTSRCWPRTRP